MTGLSSFPQRARAASITRVRGKIIEEDFMQH